MYLRVSPFRRFAIYLIDVGLIILAASFLLIPFLKLFNFDSVRYDELYNSIYNAYVDYALGKNTNILSPEMTDKMYEFLKLYMIREGIRYAISFVLLVLYLVILPYFWDGQTLGRVATRSMVICDRGDLKPKLGTIILREAVGTFLFYILFGGLIGLVSVIIAIVTERSLVDRISRTVMVLNTPVEIHHNEYQAKFFSNKENNDYYDNHQSNDNYDNNPPHDDYIDADVKEVNNDNYNNNDTNNNDTNDDDEYRVI